jgi:hypothetical protein
MGPHSTNSLSLALPHLGGASGREVKELILQMGYMFSRKVAVITFEQRAGIPMVPVVFRCASGRSPQRAAGACAATAHRKRTQVRGNRSGAHKRVVSNETPTYYRSLADQYCHSGL